MDTADVYEEWVAFSGQRAYVHREDHWNYARQPGWWVTDWRGDAHAVHVLGHDVDNRVTHQRLPAPVVMTDG